MVSLLLALHTRQMLTFVGPPAKSPRALVPFFEVCGWNGLPGPGGRPLSGVLGGNGGCMHINVLSWNLGNVLLLEEAKVVRRPL